MKLKVKKILVPTIILISGMLIGGYVTKYHYSNFQAPEETAYSVREGGYNFINPLLTCNISEDKEFEEYKPIADKFRSYINENIVNGNAADISVYFRGLNTGHWSGINVSHTYSPASLLKVPLMIAYLKDSDSNPGILNKMITDNLNTDLNQIETYKPKQSVKSGETYSISELLKYMIVYSDNNAAQLLQNNVNQESLADVYSDLGIPVSTSESQDTITPKVYSYIFRILFNATYLSKQMSQYALELMSTTDFAAGIRNGMPKDIPASQKFGERTVWNKDTTNGSTALGFRELHDCGIVYYPKNPYLLCVMTKGKDFTKLSKIISDISAMVYQETKSGVLKI